MKKMLSLMLLSLFNLSANATVPDFLRRFEQDPASASQEIPEKVGLRRKSKFSLEEIEKHKFIDAKDEFRKKVLCTESKPGEICLDKNAYLPLEYFNEDWQMRAFVGGNYEPNFFRLGSLNSGSVTTTPWTGHYWPIYRGGIGTRYGDPSFPRSESFNVNYNYYRRNYLRPLSSDRYELSKLSPSEKYDYILGDRAWSLTQSVWTEGKVVSDSVGKVETWMGICHGWAPAAFVVPEPRRAFDVDLRDRRGVVRFYPHDVKALVSQLWAQSNFSYNYLGGRCNVRHPRADGNGRITSAECFDINPASWHLALTHWVGRNRQSFVLDATYDYEVWNQPISSYRLSFFNPATKSVGSMQSSVIPLNQMRRDPFRRYRSPNTRYVVGVISDINYVVEEEPTQSALATNPLSRIVKVTYYYDLELDQNHNIIGGEWYQRGHPDMLWKPIRGAWATAVGEDRLRDWNGAMPMPAEYFNFGISASAQKTPLSKILNKLVEWSHGRR